MDREFYVDPDTGGRKEIKSARFDLIPPDVLWLLAEHYGYGASKYGERNMELGYKFSVGYAALQRHLNAWYGGEDRDTDPESPRHHHLISAAWHCITLIWMQLHGKGTDDRPCSSSSETVELDSSMEYTGVIQTHRCPHCGSVSDQLTITPKS